MSAAFYKDKLIKMADMAKGVAVAAIGDWSNRFVKNKEACDINE
jgi:hypothetical protein